MVVRSKPRVDINFNSLVSPKSYGFNQKSKASLKYKLRTLEYAKNLYVLLSIKNSMLSKLVYEN